MQGRKERSTGAGALFLAVIALLSFSCTRESPHIGDEIESGLFSKKIKPVDVTGFPVLSREVPLVLTVAGKTEAADRFNARAPADLKVDRVLVEEGGRVEAGAPLVRFDDEILRLRLAKAQADLQEAEAALAVDNDLLNNREQLVADGKLTPAEAQGLDEKVRLRQATMDRARTEIELYERDTDQVQVSSPIEGLVTKRHVTEGANVIEGQDLVEVVRLDPIRFHLRVPVEAAAALNGSANNAVDVSVRFPLLNGKNFSADVASIGAEAGEQAGGVEVKLAIPNSDYALKTDMKGEAVIKTQAKRKVYPVADSALIRTDKTAHVFKMDGGRARKVAVELGESFNGQPTIVRGVSDGDTLIAPVDPDLKDGALVRLDTAPK